MQTESKRHSTLAVGKVQRGHLALLGMHLALTPKGAGRAKSLLCDKHVLLQNPNSRT